jgi:hypothetical protein
VRKEKGKIRSRRAEAEAGGLRREQVETIFFPKKMKKGNRKIKVEETPRLRGGFEHKSRTYFFSKKLRRKIAKKVPRRRRGRGGLRA